jgi:predicted GNAT family acetyltransferase
VIPRCPFMVSYLQRHPDLIDVVEEPYRSELTA